MKRSHERVAEDAFCCNSRGHSFGPQDVTDQEKVERNKSDSTLDNDNGIMRDMKTSFVECTEIMRRRYKLSFGPQDVTDQEKVERNKSDPILDNDNGIMRDMKTPCVENTERMRRRNELKKDNLDTLRRLLNSARLDRAIALSSDSESEHSERSQ
jgi:transcriptional regulator of met regulon